MEVYKIKYTNDEFYGKTCHSCKTIKLGRLWRTLPKPARLFIQLHEEAHSKGAKSEEKADKYAFDKLKKQYSDVYLKQLLIALKVRTKEQFNIK